MKFTAAIFALATVAIAAPTELETRSAHTRDQTTADQCSAKGVEQVCCSGLLGCLVQVLGRSCNNDAYCCDAGKAKSAPGTLVNINALNCVKLL